MNIPEDSVSFKVLFREASADQINALEGAPTWTAHIHTDGRPCDRDQLCPRSEKTVTLLQIDVAVKDKRAEGTGWVFGTFVFDARLDDADPWRNLAPISIGWGNDQSATPGSPLEENIINEGFRDIFFGWSGRPHMGWNGSANGPVDNPRSSCVSCHSTAQFPRPDTFANILPSRLNLTDDEILHVYFQSVAGGTLFDPDVIPRPPFKSDLIVPVSLDYSLQTLLGLEQMCFACVDGRGPFDATSPNPSICPERLPVEESIATFRSMGVTRVTDAQIAPLGVECG